MRKLLLLLVFVSLSASRSKVLRIYKFTGHCVGYENVIVQYTRLIYFIKNRDYYVNATMNVTDDVEGPLKVIHKICLKAPRGSQLELDMVRCSSRDSLDTCENFRTININNICSIMNKENTPWSTLMKSMKPPVACPYKKGIFEANNVILDGANVGFVAISPNWFWKVTAKVLHQTTKEVVMCVYLEGQVV